VLRNPRVWLHAAGLWLLLGAAAHLGAHVWELVLEHGMVGQREFTMNAMKQTFSTAPLQPSMWRTFRALSASFGLLLAFAGAVDILLAWTKAPTRTLRSVALLQTVFWTLAFAVYAFMDPVVQPLAIATVAVPLHGIAVLTAQDGPDRA